MRSHFLLWEIFPTQGSNLSFLHCRQILYHLSHQGSLVMYLSAILTRDAYVWNHTGYFLSLRTHVSFPSGSDSKESPANAGGLSLTPGLGRYPEEGNGNPLQYPTPGTSHGQRSLVGRSPWGCKESDTTQQLNSRTHAPGSTSGVDHYGALWALCSFYKNTVLATQNQVSLE